MAYGGVNYEYIVSGSTAVSAATAHNLFGGYQGLSLHNNEEVAFIQVSSSATDISLSADPAVAATNNTGLLLPISGSLFDLPALRMGDASLVTVIPVIGNNASPRWTVWIRRP